MPDQNQNNPNKTNPSTFDSLTDFPSFLLNENTQSQISSNTSAFPQSNNSGNAPLKKKSKTRLVIATILGIMLLVGGIASGIILVNQNQDIREKATAGDTCQNVLHGRCVPNNYLCTTELSQVDCPSGQKCAQGTCQTPPNNTSTPTPATSPTTPPKTSTPTPQASTQCQRVTNTERETSTNALTVTQADINKCKAACPDGVIWVAKYKCDGINLSKGCQDNGVVLSWNASAGNSFPVGNLDCGTIQIDAGCKNQLNTYGNVKYLTVQANQPCNTPQPTQPPRQEDAQCTSIKVYDTNWNLIPQNQLSQLKAGDRVRFSVTGSPADKIDKARFTINGQLGQEVTSKKPGTTAEFYTEYTIPAGTTTFSIKGEVHHVTLGWF